MLKVASYMLFGNNTPDEVLSEIEYILAHEEDVDGTKAVLFQGALRETVDILLAGLEMVIESKLALNERSNLKGIDAENAEEWVKLFNDISKETGRKVL